MPLILTACGFLTTRQTGAVFHSVLFQIDRNRSSHFRSFDSFSLIFILSTYHVSRIHSLLSSKHGLSNRLNQPCYPCLHIAFYIRECTIAINHSLAPLSSPVPLWVVDTLAPSTAVHSLCTRRLSTCHELSVLAPFVCCLYSVHLPLMLAFRRPRAHLQNPHSPIYGRGYTNLNSTSSRHWKRFRKWTEAAIFQGNGRSKANIKTLTIYQTRRLPAQVVKTLAAKKSWNSTMMTIWLRWRMYQCECKSGKTNPPKGVSCRVHTRAKGISLNS